MRGRCRDGRLGSWGKAEDQRGGMRDKELERWRVGEMEVRKYGG